MQDKIPFNDKGERYGLWETYWDNGNPYYKGYFINSEQYGLAIWYSSNNTSYEKQYHAK